MASIAAAPFPILESYSTSQHHRYGYNHSWFSGNGKAKKNNCPITMIRSGKKRKLSFCPHCTSDAAASPNLYQEVLVAARKKFTQEISFKSMDHDISLAKALLYIAAEDEALIAINQEIDAHSLPSERRNTSVLSTSQEWDSLETMPLDGKTINEWLKELEIISEEIKVELLSKEIGCSSLGEVLDAVNLILFQSRGFKMLKDVRTDPNYLHLVLNSRCGCAILLSIIYIEVCGRLNVTILGSKVGEEFFIWPQIENSEELFKASSSGRSLFRIMNGISVDNPRYKISYLTSKSLSSPGIVTNRDIIEIYLANLMRLYWKRASRATPGLKITSPLEPVHEDKFSLHPFQVPLVRPQDLRLAIMASERMSILKPHNWVSRRDHGLLLYYNREYDGAVQELSICLAFAPEEEAVVLEPFVVKLHLIRIEASWKSLGKKVG